MKLYAPVDADSLIDEVLRICGTTAAVYSNKAIVSRVNNALDRYYEIIRQATRQWSADDSGQSSPPIETQNLVSGTNRYKFSSFTSEILDLLRLEVLDSNGKGIGLIPESFDDLGLLIGNASGKLSGITASSFQELYLNAPAGQPYYYAKYGNFVYLRDNPNYNYTAGLKAYFNRPFVKYSFVTCTVTAATDLVNATAHGLAANDAVIFETDTTIPAGITADTTVYYVISSGLTVDVFKVSTTIGGSTIDITDTGTGNHKFLKVSASPGIPSIHHPYLARYAALPFLIEKKLPHAGNIAQQIQTDEFLIKNFYATRGKDLRPILTVRYENNR